MANIKHRRVSLFLPAVVRHSSSSLLSWQLSWPLHKKLRSTQLPFRHLKRVSEHNSGLPVVKESEQRQCQQCQKHCCRHLSRARYTSTNLKTRTNTYVCCKTSWKTRIQSNVWLVVVKRAMFSLSRSQNCYICWEDPDNYTVMTQ